MNKERIFLWGTGSIATDVMASFGSFIDEIYDVLGFIDSDLKKQGKMYFGKIIFPPTALITQKYDKIIVLTDFINEIKKLAVGAYSCEESKLMDRFSLYQQVLTARYKNSTDTEIQKVLNNINRRGLKIFNYDFIDEYKGKYTQVLKDDSCGLFYVMHKGKRMYFNRNFTSESSAMSYYLDLLCEQDYRSPHCYTTDGFNVEDGDVVIDAGAAEGIFALDHIEKISRLYLVETDKMWIEALKHTFAPYLDKTIFVEKYLCDADYGPYASLDNITSEKVNFIKMDIEGNEWDALKGAYNLIKNSSRLRCAICCYHTDYDEYLICDLLKKYGLELTLSDGYMWFPYKTKNRLISDRLHRGVVRGEKK
ncbi:MAG: FkbM family methyltransferase [Selenomonadaceae bacterium]|nr:FkbM family methyltransferase [Selenomonadaceae bacterium]